VRVRHRCGQGMLYLRGEYRHLLDHLNAVLERRRGRKLLGTVSWAGRDSTSILKSIWVPALTYAAKSRR